LVLPFFSFFEDFNEEMALGSCRVHSHLDATWKRKVPKNIATSCHVAKKGVLVFLAHALAHAFYGKG
jgi:hypothetical protein